MQDQRIIWKPFGRLSDCRLDGLGQPAQWAEENELSLWWRRAVTLVSVAYVLFSQTLHALPGWSRLGIGFATLLAALLVTGRVLRIANFGNSAWAWLTAPFLVYCLIKAVPERGNEWPVEELFPLICAFMGALGIAFALRSGVSFKAIVYAQVFSNLCNIVAGFLGFGAESIGGDPVRYAGVTGNANDFGLQLTLGACLIWLLPAKAGWFPCSFAFFGVAYAIATSGSRTALMVVPFFLLLVFIQGFAHIKKHRVRVVVTVPLVICLLGIVLAPALLDRAKEITAVDRALDHHDSSFEKRMGMIQQAIRLWRQAPVFGNGLNGFERLSGYAGYAHNNYAELLCNTGVFGAFLYYALHLSVLLKGFRQTARLRYFAWVCVLMLLAIDVGSVNYKSKQTIMVLMILLSLPSRNAACLPGNARWSFARVLGRNRMNRKSPKTEGAND